MPDAERLAEQCEEHRARLRAMAYRMLGSTSESDAMLADSVGLALLVVLETLEPAARLAFVLHDAFGMTFDEIGPIVERSPEAARRLASGARRRLRQKAPTAP